MKLFEGKSPAERNKLIIAMVLGVLAFASLAYLFLDSYSSPKPKNQNANSAQNAGTQGAADITTSRTGTVPLPSRVRSEMEFLGAPVPVNWIRSSYSAPEPGRNIFAFYVPPVITPTPQPAATPPPPPPLTLAALSPMNVFARTGEFTIEVSGDKFTQDSAILVDNNPLPTRFINAQQLSATVPASMISNDGARQVKISTPDGKLYSDQMTLTVTAPPVPDFLYIGIIGKAHYNDTAVLKDKNNPKDLLNVQRGDVVGGRFRVTSISEREIVLTDTTLRIRHSLPFVEEKGQPAGTRPPGNRSPLGTGESGIPGIPNVPRYQPPGRTDQQLQETDVEEEAPGIPAKGSRP